MSSVAASEKSGMPMTSGKSAAFHGQAVAANTAYPEASITAIDRPTDAPLCMRRLAPRLEQRVNDHRYRDHDEDEHHGPREPRRFVARHRNVQVVLGDLAEHEP